MGYQHLWKPSYNRHIHLIPHISKSHHIIFCRQNIRDLGVNSQCLGKLVRQCYIYISLTSLLYIYISQLYPHYIPVKSVASHISTVILSFRNLEFHHSADSAQGHFIAHVEGPILKTLPQGGKLARTSY